MHNEEKFGASASGELIRTKMKFAINPSPHEKDLITKAHKLATHILYGSERYKQLWKLANELSRVHGEWVKICLEPNGTWIYAQHYLL